VRERQAWQDCLDALESAAVLDKEGDALPAVQALRKKAMDGVMEPKKVR
jgi:hypothetical protein